VNQEALRLRMAALHGREDPLLDPARFPRLLRQANDAEIADVRKVGEDDYEISDRRGVGAAPQVPVAPAAVTGSAAEQSEVPETAEHVAEPVPGGRDNGQPFGVRFRRGSRGGLRTREFPLIGVVQMDSAPVEAVPADVVAAESAEPASETGRKPARPRRAPRKKAGSSRGAAKASAAKADKTVKADASGGDPDVAPAAPAAPASAKRGRSRARKKAE
jgi:hypothetical protein